ncbi:MAG: hypothetical protein PT936_09075 [Treponema sp.]|nr:hypothetical protein [Treponema sp.]
MKKNTILIGIIFSISLFFISCKLDVKPENTLHRPDVDVQGSVILVRGTYTSSDIQYINVFRKDITNNENPINIGIIFPSGFNAENKTFSFTDTTATEGNKYVYFCRYYEGKFGYYQTEYSEEKIAPAGSSPITLSVDPAFKLSYSDVGKILSLDGTAPTFSPLGTDNYDFALVATNGKETQCFYLANKDWKAKDKDDTLVSTKEWNLQVLFPESFLNTEIEILGLVGQKKEINADEKVQHIFWTPLVSIPVDNDNHTIQDNKFYVNIPKGTNGIDYGYFK